MMADDEKESVVPHSDTRETTDDDSISVSGPEAEGQSAVEEVKTSNNGTDDADTDIAKAALDDDTENKQADQGDDTTATTDKAGDGESDRNSTFEKAQSFFSSNKLDLALECYLQCIKGIEKGSGFLYLPQCLHKIAEVYHLKDEDEKAIQFLKAEKIYYETALIDTQKMQEKIDEITGDERVSDELEAEILRAVEYENLAKLCLEKHQCQLALEFSGKATKLYQKHYGDDHEATQRCLDLFTSVYAEVGREEYTSKLSQFETEATYDADHTKDTENDTASGDQKPAVRRRKPKQEQSEEIPPTESDQSTTEQTQQQIYTQDSYLDSAYCTAVLWITLVICLFMAVSLFSIVYCKVTPTSWTCHWARVQYRSLSEHLGFLAYKLSKK